MEQLSLNQYIRATLTILVVPVLFFNCNGAYSQTVTHANFWTNMSYYADNPGTKWSYLINPQVRFIDNQYKLQQVNLYMGLGYQLKDDFVLLFGVFRNYIQQANGTVSGENRLWQQASINFIETSKFDLTGRSRLEERIMNGTNAYANRFRQLITLEIPFVKGSQLIIGNEFFLQVNRPQWVSQYTYSQNRFNLGVRGNIGEMVFETGYLNQYAFNNTNAMSNVLYFNIAYAKKYTLTIRDILLDN